MITGKQQQNPYLESLTPQEQADLKGALAALELWNDPTHPKTAEENLQFKADILYAATQIEYGDTYDDWSQRMKAKVPNAIQFFTALDECAKIWKQNESYARSIFGWGESTNQKKAVDFALSDMLSAANKMLGRIEAGKETKHQADFKTQGDHPEKSSTEIKAKDEIAQGLREMQAMKEAMQAEMKAMKEAMQAMKDERKGDKELIQEAQQQAQKAKLTAETTAVAVTPLINVTNNLLGAATLAAGLVSAQGLNRPITQADGQNVAGLVNNNGNILEVANHHDDVDRLSRTVLPAFGKVQNDAATAVQQAATAVQQAAAAAKQSSDEHIIEVMTPVMNSRR